MSSLLILEHLPKLEGRNCSGQGQQTVATSKMQSTGDPGRARNPDDTTTLANSPTYNPVNPVGTERETVDYISSQKLIYMNPVDLTGPECTIKSYY